MARTIRPLDFAKEFTALCGNKTEGPSNSGDAGNVTSPRVSGFDLSAVAILGGDKLIPPSLGKRVA